MQLLVYLAAPPLALLMDRMYYGSVKNIIFGFFPATRKYAYGEFANYRLIGIVLSSLIIAYAGVARDIVPGMVGAVIFLFSHSLIYLDMYRRERLSKW